VYSQYATQQCLTGITSYSNMNASFCIHLLMRMSTATCDVLWLVAPSPPAAVSPLAGEQPVLTPRDGCSRELGPRGSTSEC